ncbi:DUF5994 family protein [Nocardia sp. NBC_01329]|uniref:DUF5994 family protein n=1 Tax=Nocardia sp. NBC_01329 TaxID=2903594 RepID=UPI002E1473FA|nr:DUF5994 family protein [Nocardia sp. NBC_01329]
MTLQQKKIPLEHPARFSLRSGAAPASRRLPTPRAPRPGIVDGAWWPRTDDLVTELAGLAALQRGRAGAVDRIMYDTDTWGPAPKRTTVGGCPVRLDGYRHLPAHTLCFLGSDRTRRVLLVIPAETEAATAQALLSAASRPGNELTAEELMSAAEGNSPERTADAAAFHRWDNEGGHGAPPLRTLARTSGRRI